jgi:hypothetical protein
MNRLIPFAAAVVLLGTAAMGHPVWTGARPSHRLVRLGMRVPDLAAGTGVENPGAGLGTMGGTWPDEHERHAHRGCAAGETNGTHESASHRAPHFASMGTTTSFNSLFGTAMNLSRMMPSASIT